MCTLLQVPCRESRSSHGAMFYWWIVSSLALWVLWKVRSSKLYNVEKPHVVDQVKYLWDLLVHMVKGDYDSYKGYGNTT